MLFRHVTVYVMKSYSDSYHTLVAVYTHARIHTHTSTHTLDLYLPEPVLATWPPIQGVSQQEVTRLVVPLAAGTPALSPHLHAPLSALGYSSIGLVDP